MAIQLASKSVGKSIPLICHKVEKPNELKKMLDKMQKNVVSRWCICNAKCHCRNTPAGYSSNFNTAALLGDYSTA